MERAADLALAANSPILYRSQKPRLRMGAMADGST
jgi:hypothetical protein